MAKKQLISLLTILPILLSPIANAEEITTYRQQRYRNVDGQNNWVTCGPATLASLFQYYYNIPINEKQAIKKSEEKEKKCKKYLNQDKEQIKGFSFCALEKVLQEENFKTARAKGLEVKDIKQYSNKRFPIILHLTEPNDHFVAAIGVVKNKLIVADPSQGQYLLKLSKLDDKKKISGKVLFIKAPTKAQQENAMKKQAEVLEWARKRQKKLETIKNFQ